MIITLKHEQSNITKQVKVGFSWTTFFFGFFPALFRGDLKWMAIMFITAILTFGIGWIVFPFIYNKMYIKDLLEKGYVPSDENSTNVLKSSGIIG